MVQQTGKPENVSIGQVCDMSEKLDTFAIVSLLKKTTGYDNETIPLHAPLFMGEEWEYVKDCLDTGWVSTVGKYVSEFEKRLQQYTGIKHAIAMVNGTAALHICLKLLGVSQGDEVLIPALTFVATANAVCYCGAIPHLVESDRTTLGIDTNKLDQYLNDISEMKKGICYNKKSMRPIKAIIVMHTFGHPADIDSILEICRRYKIELIEDVAEAMGSLYKGKHVGGFGKVAALSFNGNKIITTGGGGAVLTNDSNLAELAKHLSTTAKLLHPWAFIHDQTGYNYRMPNINAALGCAQIKNIEEFIKLKRNLAEKYRKAFQNINGITVFQEARYARSNYWLNVLVLDDEYAAMRDEILTETNKQGISTRPAWTLMHKLVMYQTCPHMDLSTTESLERRIINIPSSAHLGMD